MRIAVVKNILDANSKIARENRTLFESNGLAVINLMSSPGAGKTTLLEQMGNHFQGRLSIGVIEGDIQTTLDAERVAAAGLQAVQIETDGACHLDANMIQNALADLDLSSLDLLVVENVGNLVCPAEFDVGENHKVMMLSVTEGDDKPLKYPLMFKESRVLLISKVDLLVVENVGNLVCPAEFDVGEDHKVMMLSVTEGDDKPYKYPLMFKESSVLLISKVDLLPHLHCDIEKIKQAARSINPALEIFEISSYSGQGLDDWHNWVQGQVKG